MILNYLRYEINATRRSRVSGAQSVSLLGAHLVLTHLVDPRLRFSTFFAKICYKSYSKYFYHCFCLVWISSNGTTLEVVVATPLKMIAKVATSLSFNTNFLEIMVNEHVCMNLVLLNKHSRPH